MCIITAYPLSKKYLPGRKTIMSLVVFTMFFSGGLVPNYLLIKSLGWIDTIWAIVIPGAISAYYVILMRTFFEGIPTSLEEAAAIDGLNDVGILIKIYLPLSNAILSTIALFYAVTAWNSWFSAIIYISSVNKYPVMIFLRSILYGADLANKNPDMAQSATYRV
jgi:putative aldouronate transport system permease protein